MDSKIGICDAFSGIWRQLVKDLLIFIARFLYNHEKPV